MRHSMLTRSKTDKSNESVPLKLTPVFRLTRRNSFADCVQRENWNQYRENVEPKTPMRSKQKARFETLKNELNMNRNKDTKNDRRVAFRLTPPTLVYETRMPIIPVPESTKQNMSPINPSDVGQFSGFDNNIREFDAKNQEAFDCDCYACLNCSEYNAQKSSKSLLNLQFISPSVVYVAMFGLLMAIVCYFIYN